MAKSLDLAEIVALADSGAYGGDRVLSANTAALALCSGVFLSELRNWQGAGFSLTSDEIDTIQEMVAVLEYEVSEGGDIVQPAMIKIGEAVATDDVSSLLLDDIDGDNYARWELVIDGIRSDAEDEVHDWLLVEFNGETANSMYNSFNWFRNTAGEVVATNPGNYPKIAVYGGCAGDDGDLLNRATVKMSISRPEASDRNQLMWDATISSPVAADMSRTVGSGMFEVTDAIDSIEIFPLLGSEFRVGPFPGLIPRELRMSLYGVT